MSIQFTCSSCAHLYFYIYFLLKRHDEITSTRFTACRYDLQPKLEVRIQRNRKFKKYVLNWSFCDQCCTCSKQSPWNAYNVEQSTCRLHKPKKITASWGTLTSSNCGVKSGAHQPAQNFQDKRCILMSGREKTQIRYLRTHICIYMLRIS